MHELLAQIGDQYLSSVELAYHRDVKKQIDRVYVKAKDADVYLLTDLKPAMLPDPSGVVAPRGLRLTHSAAASDSLLADLRSDKGMSWVPRRAWLSKVEINAKASDLRFDLAIDASGAGQPSLRDAGFAPFGPMKPPPSPMLLTVVLLAGVGLLSGAMGWVAAASRGRSGRPLAGA